MAEAIGWAVVSLTQVYVNTISDSRRGAIVNWLVTAQKRMVYTHHTDQDIEEMWGMWKHGQDVEVRQIIISDDPALTGAFLTSRVGAA